MVGREGVLYVRRCPSSRAPLLGAAWEASPYLPATVSKKIGSGEPLPNEPNVFVLQDLNVLCLPTLGAFLDFELDRLAFLQAAESIRLDRREMHENVFAGLTADKAKTLGVVKPLYCSLFHVVTFSVLNFSAEKSRCR